MAWHIISEENHQLSAAKYPGNGIVSYVSKRNISGMSGNNHRRRRRHGGGGRRHHRMWQAARRYEETLTNAAK